MDNKHMKIVNFNSDYYYFPDALAHVWKTLLATSRSGENRGFATTWAVVSRVYTMHNCTILQN